jgi:hypothetical protein
MAKNKLPRILYAFIENAGTQDEFINTSRTVDEITTEDGEMKVGVYELTEMKTAINKTELLD